MISKIKKNLCTGCKMCADICPVNAIMYSTDGEGFYYPIVDYSKCIKCNRCVTTCPSLSKPDLQKDKPKVFAGWINNADVRLQSTSGGIYYALASYFIRTGGFIVGSRYTEDYKGAEHIISNTKEGLYQIMGSKYFQSNTQDIYGKVKKLLDDGEKVLFCGTPCQSAALQSFLNIEYDNLYLIDFICRGVNSPKAFRKYMEELEKEYHSKIENVHFKNKKNGWTSLATHVKFENGIEYHKERNDNLWIRGFIQGNLYMRPSCHQCRYKEIPRISDITIGDFWGIQGADKKDIFNGISVIMSNSEKGKFLLSEICNTVTLSEQSLELAEKGNPCILTPASEGKNRNKFFELLDEYPFTVAVSKCME